MSSKVDLLKKKTDRRAPSSIKIEMAKNANVSDGTL